MITRAEVAPGPGVVIRYGHVVAWTSPDASVSLLAFLIESARNLAGSPEAGQILVDHLASVLSSGDPEPQVGFAVAGPGQARWVGLVHGPAQIWDGRSWTTTPIQPGWLRTICTPSPALSINAASSKLPEGSPSSVLDLEAGVVPGGGLTVWPDATVERITVTTGAGARSAVDQGGSGEPTATLTTSSGGGTTEPGMVFDLRPGASDPSPTVKSALPSGGDATFISGSNVTVDGVRCHNGHFNRPGMIVCAVCSSLIRDVGELPERGPRPPLGCLVTSDGSVYRLDSGYVVGAEEDSAHHTSELSGATSDAPGASGRSTRKLRLGGDPMRRGNAEILLEGWDAVVVDGGSEVGTYIYPPGATAWQKMPPLSKAILAPGSHVSFGRDVVTYINPWVPATSPAESDIISSGSSAGANVDEPLRDQ